jgi:hypothetical protein
LFDTLTFAEILGRTTFLGTLSLTVLIDQTLGAKTHKKKLPYRHFGKLNWRALTNSYTSEPIVALQFIIRMEWPVYNMKWQLEDALRIILCKCI